MLPALATLLLGGALVGAYFVRRHAVGIVEDNLLRMEQIHLDFSAQGERRPDPAPGGAGPLVLFLHETAADGGSVAKYLGFLGPPYRVLAPDFAEPAHTAQATGLGVFCVPEMVEEGRRQLRRARELAGADPLVVFGVSRGASLAALTILAEPGVAVDGVVLESFFDPVDLLTAKVQRFAPIYLGARLAGLLPAGALRHFARLGLERVAARLGVEFLRTEAAAVDLPVPALFLHGGRDPAAPLEAVRRYVSARRTQGRPETRLEEFPRARHNGAVQKEPARYREVVGAFLAEVTGVPQRATRAEESVGGGEA